MQPRSNSDVALDKLLEEASWLLSHAQALANYGRAQEAATELARAANYEEEAACWLAAAGREQEAVVHRVSAASCYEQLGESARAVPLLRAALSAPLTAEYQQSLRQQLDHCLARAQEKLRRAS